MTYDRIGRLETVNDAFGFRTFGYDGLKPGAEVLSGLREERITRHCDGLGRPSGVMLGDGAVCDTRYGYDTKGRFGSVTWKEAFSADRVATIAYENDSDLIKGISTDNGFSATYTHEPNRDLRKQIENVFNGQLVSQYDYTYGYTGMAATEKQRGYAVNLALTRRSLRDEWPKNAKPGDPGCRRREIIPTDCESGHFRKARCGNSARRDLCGGRQATGVPTPSTGLRGLALLHYSNTPFLFISKSHGFP